MTVGETARCPHREDSGAELYTHTHTSKPTNRGAFINVSKKRSRSRKCARSTLCAQTKISRPSEFEFLSSSFGLRSDTYSAKER
jgi:hypothetical protein